MSNSLVCVLVVVGILIVLALLQWKFRIVKLLKVNEGTGAAFKYAGEYNCSIMTLKKSYFGRDDVITPNTVDEESAKSTTSSTNENCFIWRYRGWVFYLNWLVEPTRYLDKNNDDGFGEGNTVFLNEIQRDFTLEKVEDIKDMPFDVKVAFRMKVVDIYQFLYVAPKDVIARAIEAMQSNMRKWVRRHDYVEIQDFQKNGGQIDLSPDARAVVVRIKEKDGVEILMDSILIKEVGMPAADQDARAAEKREELLARAATRAHLGRMLENRAVTMGITEEKVEDMGNGIKRRITRSEQVIIALMKDTDGKAQLAKMHEKLDKVIIQKAMVASGIRPILVGTAQGDALPPIEGIITTLLGLLRGVDISSSSSPSSGDSGGGQNPNSGGKRKRGKPKTDDDDEDDGDGWGDVK